MNRNTLNASYLLLTGIIVVIIVLAIISGQPMIRSIIENRAAVDQTNARISERNLFLESIDRRRAQLLSHQTEEEQLKVILPSEDRTSDIVRLIHNAADQSGGEIVELSNQSRAASRAIAEANRHGSPADFVPLGFTITYEGSYEQTRRFIATLEAAARPLDIIGLQISGAEGEENASELSVRFQLRFYKLNQ